MSQTGVMLARKSDTGCSGFPLEKKIKFQVNFQDALKWERRGKGRVVGCEPSAASSAARRWRGRKGKTWRIARESRFSSESIPALTCLSPIPTPIKVNKPCSHDMTWSLRWHSNLGTKLSNLGGLWTFPTKTNNTTQHFTIQNVRFGWYEQVVGLSF